MVRENGESQSNQGMHLPNAHVCLHLLSCEYLPGSKPHQVCWDLFPRNYAQNHPVKCTVENYGVWFGPH